MRRWLFVVVLAGCGSDGPKYDPPPPEAVASCALAARYGSTTTRNEYWFDAASRLIQIDGFGNESTKLAYDDQGRLVSETTQTSTATWTYEPGRATQVLSGGSTYIYDLGPDGQAVHYEGPEEVAASDRRVIDYQYDAAGHLTSVNDYVPPAQRSVPTLDTYHYEYTYDNQGRVASSMWNLDESPTMYAYTASPDQLVITLSGPRFDTLTYDLDDAGRVINAEVFNGFDFRRAYSYAYVDDTITATPTEIPAGNSEPVVTSSGVCPGISTSLAPERPFPVDYLRSRARIALALPNPPVEALGY